jgi:DNA-directed RNA polymerase specialized sigma24 family protein
MSDVTLTWEHLTHTYWPNNYGPTVFDFAYRLTGKRADASDLAQRVLIRVRQGLAGYQPVRKMPDEELS